MREGGQVAVTYNHNLGVSGTVRPVELESPDSESRRCSRMHDVLFSPVWRILEVLENHLVKALTAYM